MPSMSSGSLTSPSEPTEAVSCTSSRSARLSNYRVGTRDVSPTVEFTWAGDDDGSPISGRGWARRGPDGLIGRLFIHEGDGAEFVAKSFPRTGRER